MGDRLTPGVAIGDASGDNVKLTEGVDDTDADTDADGGTDTDTDMEREAAGLGGALAETDGIDVTEGDSEGGKNSIPAPAIPGSVAADGNREGNGDCSTTSAKSGALASGITCGPVAESPRRLGDAEIASRSSFPTTNTIPIPVTATTSSKHSDRV